MTHPEHDLRVFGAAADEESLAELERMEVEILKDGQISGLNGAILGAAADSGLRGACLLGEMPHIFAQFPFPKASLVVPKVFSMITEIEIDTVELLEQSQAMEQKLSKLLSQVEKIMDQQMPVAEEQSPDFEPPEDEQLDPEDEQFIEQLFNQAEQDRSKAYELKRELDNLNVFQKYEDRFLDLFKDPK